MSDPVLDALENPVPAPILAMVGDPGPMLDHDDGGSRHERDPFPLGGPVKCLGIQSDMSGSIRCYYLDCLGQILGLDANNRHGKNAMIAMYGEQSSFLEVSWPQWSKPKKEYNKSEKIWVEIEAARIIGFDQAEASRCHIEECVRKGIFDPTGKLRGRGAHRSDKGHLVLHLGDQLLLPKERANGATSGYHYSDPGAHGGYVYPAFAPSMRPYHDASGDDAGQKILAQLHSWSYRRPLLDPMLLLGGLVASQLGGFLAWRPVMWVVGPRGTGKSTLDGEPSANEGFIGHLLGPARMNTANASEAAIRQTLKNSTVPVFIDELEPDAPKEKIDALIALARVAAGGAKGHRGGQDQQAHEFTLRSPFWFSSILQPPLQAADSSRIVTIELKKLRNDVKKPNFFTLKAPILGAQLLRRVIEQAKRLDQTIALYSEALQLRGLDARGQNVYGTLLACADIALYDELPDSDLVNEWAMRIDPARLAENGDAVSEERGCIEHLLTSQVQVRGGDARMSLGSWVGNAVSEAANGEYDSTYSRQLQQIGLKIVNAKMLNMVTGPDGGQVPRWGAQNYQAGVPGYLAIAWRHRGLDPLFQDTKWRGGVWKQALARVEKGWHVAADDAAGIMAASGEIGAIDGVKVKFDRISANAVLVPLSAIIDLEELPASSAPAAVAAWMGKILAGAL